MKRIFLITAAAIVVVSALAVVLVATFPRPSSPTRTYSGSLEVEPADYRPPTYGGMQSSGSGFLVLNVSFHNTGTIDVNFNRSSWAVLDPYGGVLLTPSELFNSSLSVAAAQTVRDSIVFDMHYDSLLASLSAILPDGKKITVPLTTSLPVRMLYGIQSDGTNWTLTVVSTPLALSLSEMNLTIRSSTGSVLLPTKSLVSLAYAVDRAAFVPSSYSNSTWILVGDRLLLDFLRYPDGSQIELSIGARIWSTVTLQH